MANLALSLTEYLKNKSDIPESEGIPNVLKYLLKNASLEYDYVILPSHTKTDYVAKLIEGLKLKFLFKSTNMSDRHCPEKSPSNDAGLAACEREAERHFKNIRTYKKNSLTLEEKAILSKNITSFKMQAREPGTDGNSMYHALYTSMYDKTSTCELQQEIRNAMAHEYDANSSYERPGNFSEIGTLGVPGRNYDLLIASNAFNKCFFIASTATGMWNVMRYPTVECSDATSIFLFEVGDPPRLWRRLSSSQKVFTPPS